jgi:outer membrane protein with beta-barrel domain
MKAVAAALLLTVGATSASAQDAPRGDVFAGYSMLASDGETMHGGHAALGWDVSGRIGLLLDVSGHQGSDAQGTDVGVLSLMAGPRVTFGSGRVRPFVHVIGGIVRSKASVSVFDVEISESTTDFGGAAGGGFDLGFGVRWALRLAADYRVVKIDEETARDPRFSAGVVCRFGAR